MCVWGGGGGGGGVCVHCIVSIFSWNNSENTKFRSTRLFSLI